MRTKLAAVLVVPSIALLAVAGVQVRGLVDEAAVLGEFASQVRLGEKVGSLVHELQTERDRTVGELATFEAAGSAGDPGQLSGALRAQQQAVDAIVTQLREAGAVVEGGPAWKAAYARVMSRLDTLASAREGVRAGALPRRAAHDVYGRTIDALLALQAVPDPGPEYADLAELRGGYVELARTKELGSQLRARIFAVGSAAGFAPGDYVDIADLRAQRLAALVRFRGAAPASQVDSYDAALAGRVSDRSNQIELSVIDSAGRSGFTTDANSWWQAATDEQNKVRGVEVALLADAARQATGRSDDQWRETWLVAGAIGAALLAALALSLLIGRSMARSLRTLRREALQVAQIELPQVLERLRDAHLTARQGRVPDIPVRPPSVRGLDEVGEVADAFGAVHASAVSLALEQAAMRHSVNAMFVNLARRSQVLVERQLELLDDLERDQDDPDVLAALFRLDHLAARMRRNDESLLVLAGNDNARRWNTPIAVSAAILAAVAEVEQYTRVRHNAHDSWHIVGHAVADIVHLLAELLENATAFSPPDTEVRIDGVVVGGRVLIEISDLGIGLSPESLEAANALLENPPAADVAASERMGLFVVSHLAARHGVRVRLRAADRGTIASVWVPPSLLAPAPEPTDALAPTLRHPRSVRPSAAPARVSSVATAARSIPPLPPLSLTFTGRTALTTAPLAIPAIAAAPAQAAPAHPRPPEQPVEVAEQRVRSVGTGRLRRVDAGDDSAWWSRTGTPVLPTTGAAAPAPPEVPITGGVTLGGLPVRVPMAQLPVEDAAPRAVGRVGVPHDEPDPDSVGSTLARFHGGVRRAEAEENTDQTAAPRWWEE